MKMQKKTTTKKTTTTSRGEGQGGCERRIEVIVKMQKKSGVVLVMVNEELKLL